MLVIQFVNMYFTLYSFRPYIETKRYFACTEKDGHIRKKHHKVMLIPKN
jgi:hypothetical protein